MSDLQKTNEISTEELAKYLDLFGFSDIPQKEKELFIEVCKMGNLNPFKREAHISAYGEGKFRKFSVITGYEVYIKRAEESGRLAGWESPVIRPCKTAKTDIKGNISFIDDIQAEVTIYRKDFEKPFTHSVKFSEYVQTTKDGNVTAFWQKPESQLKKVAISQGFRLCFSDVLKNLPLTKEEVSESSYYDITNEQQPEPTKNAALNTPENINRKPEFTTESKNFLEAAEKIAKSDNPEELIKKLSEKYIVSDETREILISTAMDIQEAEKGDENGK